MTTMPIDQIKVVSNVRIGDLEVESLTDSIKTHGVLVPVLVRSDGTLIAGHRRYAAAKLAGLSEVPVQVSDEGPTIALQLVENLQRQNLDPIEEAYAYQDLLNEKLTQRDIAAQVGINQSQVSRRLSLLRCSDAVQKAVRNGSLDVNVAVELAKVENHAAQDLLLSDPEPWKIKRALEHQERMDKVTKLEKEVAKAGILTVDQDEVSGGKFHMAEQFASVAEIKGASLPEDAVLVVGHDYEGNPTIKAYVPNGGVRPTPDPEKLEKKAQRLARAENLTQLQKLVETMSAKDSGALIQEQFVLNYLTPTTARGVCTLLNLDITSAPTTKRRVDTKTGEVTEVQVNDPIAVAMDWYGQSVKQAWQVVAACLIDGGGEMVEAYVAGKGLTPYADLVDSFRRELSES